MLSLGLTLSIGTGTVISGGGGGGVAAMTWSTTDFNSANGVTFSNGNLSALGGSVHNTIRASRAVNYDKTYWEIHCDTGGTNGLDEVGVADSLADLTAAQWGSTVDGLVASAHAGVLYEVNGGFTSYNNSRNSTPVSWIANDILQTALDRVNGLVWFGKANTWLNGTPGVSGGLSIVGIGSPLFPATEWRGGTVTLNPGTTPGGTAGFNFTPPSGFVAP